jgi:transcriptional regulator with XRE-family HTH domain
MTQTFGAFVRERREALATNSRDFSLRQVAGRIGVEPAYLSKVERDEVPPPSEDTIRRLAAELGFQPDMIHPLLARAGKVSRELQDIILARPELFAKLIRELKDAPEEAVFRVVREVRDGNW